MTPTPNWMREIDVALAAHPQIAVTGNIGDSILLPNPNPAAPIPMLVSVTQAVQQVLQQAGHVTVLAYHPSSGARSLLDGSGNAAALLRGSEKADGDEDPAAALTGLLQRVSTADRPCALIVEGASRLAPEADFTGTDVHRLFVTAEQLASTARPNRVEGNHVAPLYNSVFWLIDRQVDLPHWLVGTDLLRVVSVPLPDLGDRVRAANRLFPSLPGADQAQKDSERLAITRDFADRAGGLTLRSMSEIGRLAIDRGISVTRLDDAVRTFRVGIPDNPWTGDELKERIGRADAALAEEVHGQPHAIRKAVDILIRSAMGLSGAHTSSSSARPQGVLFLAGPTGVGKTELAKQIAKLVFGNVDRILRFDMSEFSSEHSEARLIGAPPGYTGHSSGGELTNGIRQDPFRLVLFDEIEKAHPRILDKFLQILEDGRLTDGAGSTVHFSESLIVFTSNLGIYRDTPAGRVPVVTRGTPYPQLESKVQEAITDHFTTVIGRPELLNRLGDNIVVFDFISDEVAKGMVPKFLRNVALRVQAATGRTVRFRPSVVEQVFDAARERLDFGGRGVASTVETMLVNPLARAMFHDRGTGEFVISEIADDGDGWVVR